jgi:hypothetical protein
MTPEKLPSAPIKRQLKQYGIKQNQYMVETQKYGDVTLKVTRYVMAHTALRVNMVGK